MKFPPEELIALDTENTRLCSEDEYTLTSIAVISSVHGPRYVTPVQPEYGDFGDWEDHLCLPRGLLATAPTPDQVRRTVRALTFCEKVLVWNAQHEQRVLPFLSEKSESGRPLHYVQDLMIRCAPILRPWNSHFGAYQWPALADAARDFGLGFAVGGHHTAAADAEMLLQIWRLLEAHPIHRGESFDRKPHLFLVDQADQTIPF